MSYIPGDILVSAFTISSERGSLDLSKSFVKASIYESIFTPGILADITVLDTDDQISTLKLVGDETVDIEFQVPGGQTCKYKFALHAIDNANMAENNLSSKRYLVKAVSEEVLQAKTNYVQKSYKKQISDIVKDIHKEYLKSEKEIEVEETKGTQKIVVPNMNPYRAIDMVRRRAVSNENKSSTYIYYESRSDGGDQIFKFTTIEKLFGEGTVKTYNQVDTAGYSMDFKMQDQILALETPQHFNTLDRIRYGGKRRVSEYDLATQTWKTKDVSTKDTDYKTGGDGSYDSSKFKEKYLNPKIPPQALIPVDNAQRAKTHIPESTKDQQAFIATLMQNALKMRVTGDFVLKPGVMIEANIPAKKATTANRENDPLLSGKMLVSRIHHDIGEVGERPRYTCVIECLKGAMEEGV